ncbi:hypothetical protein A5717_26245 [Mycolicibacterium porcinum]|uniref:hypothetical protein n=1 Tax=Mycolicibacterium porcinum TaxID=39693 RepID=UPI00080BED8D|nr:hypothetical protein [Mycolicibacterium porcinum]OCB09276.1 hypothetical protein A5717_26245 [Mycolicibacterium porcinum]
MTAIAFVDTETLGLDPDAPIWEFAALHVGADGLRETIAFTIQHDPAVAAKLLPDLPDKLQIDYRNRFDFADAVPEDSAATMIEIITRGATMVCCNPVFDEPRLAALLRRNKLEPGWHYHPLDTSSLVIGYLAGLGFPQPPHLWKSDLLSAAIGIDSDDYMRHTAMGDVEWIADQWDKMMGRASA